MDDKCEIRRYYFDISREVDIVRRIQAHIMVDAVLEVRELRIVDEKVRIDARGIQDLPEALIVVPGHERADGATIFIVEHFLLDLRLIHGQPFCVLPDNIVQI